MTKPCHSNLCVLYSEMYGLLKNAEPLWVTMMLDHEQAKRQRAARAGRLLALDPAISKKPTEQDLWGTMRTLAGSLREAEDALAGAKIVSKNLGTAYQIDRQIQTIFRNCRTKGCIVCVCMHEQDPVQVQFLLKDLMFAPQADKELVIRNHGRLVPDDHERPLVHHVRRVEVVLERHGPWHALKLHEFEKSGKTDPSSSGAAADIGTRDRRVSELQLLGRGSMRDENAGGANSTVGSSKLTFRQHVKDVCVFIPEQVGWQSNVDRVRNSASILIRRQTSPRLGYTEDSSNSDSKYGKITEEVDRHLVKCWIQRCKLNHGRCAAEASQKPRNLTLLDARRMCLVDFTEEGSLPNYLALSYVWGLVSQPVLTTAVTEAWHVEGGLRAEIFPATIADAIRLTAEIGYDYIWIDALCIVQDNFTRYHQISQMHAIYQQADMTIVAADGSDCGQGLSGVSSAGYRMERHGSVDIPGGLRLHRVPLSTRLSIEACPWRMRGWTFQEELCSRRAVVLLPEVMVFSCQTAVWREDLDLETGESLETDQGLESVSRLLLSRGTMQPETKISLFRDLVKQYIQRTLSRTDDMENAFAGVAGMLEPTLGPMYHGIPEEAFEEVLSGCWSGDTTLRRRHGFPSWSWTGWIYGKEQNDMSIRPQYSQAYDFASPITAFYKLYPDVEALGCNPRTSDVDNIFAGRPELTSHFENDEAVLQARLKGLQQGSDIPPHLIAFHTSCATLKVRATPGASVGLSREYRVVHPQSNRDFARIRLAVDFVEKNGNLHDFIVMAHDRNKRCFRLMLVFKGQIASERVNVTTQSRPVSEEDWWEVAPRRELIVMA